MFINELYSKRRDFDSDSIWHVYIQLRTKKWKCLRKSDFLERFNYSHLKLSLSLICTGHILVFTFQKKNVLLGKNPGNKLHGRNIYSAEALSTTSTTPPPPIDHTLSSVKLLAASPTTSSWTYWVMSYGTSGIWENK